MLKLWGVSSPFKGFWYPYLVLVDVPCVQRPRLRKKNAVGFQLCWQDWNGFVHWDLYIYYDSYVNKSTYTYIVVQFWSSDSSVSCGAMQQRFMDEISKPAACVLLCADQLLLLRLPTFYTKSTGTWVFASRCRLVLNQDQIEIMVTLHVRFVMGTFLQLSNSQAWSWKSLWNTDGGVIHTIVWNPKKAIW